MVLLQNAQWFQWLVRNFPKLIKNSIILLNFHQKIFRDFSNFPITLCLFRTNARKQSMICYFFWKMAVLSLLVSFLDSELHRFHFVVGPSKKIFKIIFRSENPVRIMEYFDLMCFGLRRSHCNCLNFTLFLISIHDK